jgi:hypothetical protein
MRRTQKIHSYRPKPRVRSGLGKKGLQSRVGSYRFKTSKVRQARGASRGTFNRATRTYIRKNLQGKPGKVNQFRARRNTLYRGTH